MRGPAPNASTSNAAALKPGSPLQRIESVCKPRRSRDPDPRGLPLIAEVVAERYEVDEVVGMEVADDDRVEVGRIEEPSQPGERAVAEVEQKARSLVTDQIAGSGRAGPIGVGRPRADNAEPHRGYLFLPGGSLVG